MISAVLLAAGESRRMAEFKQFLDWRNKTFVENCVDNLLGSRAGEVIVVTGHREADVRRAIGDRDVRFAHNREYRSGMASSIISGVQAVSQTARACMLVLVDQPWIDSGIINRIIEVYEQTRPLIVIPSYEGKNGHPILLDISLKEEILKMEPALGLRQVVGAHQREVERVGVSDRGVLEDCDSPEDYERLLKR